MGLSKTNVAEAVARTEEAKCLKIFAKDWFDDEEFQDWLRDVHGTAHDEFDDLLDDFVDDPYMDAMTEYRHGTNIDEVPDKYWSVICKIAREKGLREGIVWIIAED